MVQHSRRVLAFARIDCDVGCGIAACVGSNVAIGRGVKHLYWKIAHELVLDGLLYRKVGKLDRSKGMARTRGLMRTWDTVIVPRIRLKAHHLVVTGKSAFYLGLWTHDCLGLRPLITICHTTTILAPDWSGQISIGRQGYSSVRLIIVRLLTRPHIYLSSVFSKTYPVNDLEGITEADLGLKCPHGIIVRTALKDL